MRPNITIGAILLALLLCGYFCAISERFREVQNARGKEFTMTTMKEVQRILEDCAVLCWFTKTCLSFFHDKADNTCRFVAGTLLESQMTPAPSRPEMSYFISDLALDDPPGFDCPLNFDETRIPGVCLKQIETLMDNDAARTQCGGYASGNLTGHLLTVYTREMYVEVATRIGSGNYHIDGSKRLPDGAWVDWKGDELAVVRWDGGQPDNLLDSDEKCVFIPHYGKAHDIPCSGFDGKILCQLEYVK